MRSKWILWSIAGLLIAGLALTGCGGGNKAPAAGGGQAGGAQTGGGAAPAAQKPVVILQGVDPTTLDPHMHAETPAANILNNMFDALVYRNPEMKLEPGLAQSYKAIDDKTWEFKLRQGVKFHNGDELTSEDVKFSLERILKPEQKSQRRSNISAITKVEAPDKYTVVIRTDQPYPILPNRLADEHIISKKWTESKNNEISKDPMGTGAYKFVKWVKDEGVEMEANPGYWRGAPKIQKVIFKPVPEAATRIAQLQSGQADIIVNVTPNQVPSIKGQDKTDVAEVPSVRVIYIAAQSRKGKAGNPKLEDPRVRQALRMAVDGDSIVKNVLLGNAFPVAVPLTPQHFGFDQSVQPVKYDEEGARKLLAEAGAANLEIQFDSPNGRYLLDKEVAQAIAGMLEKVGVKVNFKTNEWGNHVQLMQSREQKGLYLLGWGNSTWDADGTLLPLLTSTGAFSTYENPQFDKPVTDARQTLDGKKRQELYNQALKVWQQDAPWIYQWRQKDVYGVSKRINWQARADERLTMFEASLK